VEPDIPGKTPEASWRKYQAGNDASWPQAVDHRRHSDFIPVSSISYGGGEWERNAGDKVYISTIHHSSFAPNFNLRHAQIHIWKETKLTTPPPPCRLRRSSSSPTPSSSPSPFFPPLSLWQSLHLSSRTTTMRDTRLSTLGHTGTESGSPWSLQSGLQLSRVSRHSLLPNSHEWL